MDPTGVHERPRVPMDAHGSPRASAEAHGRQWTIGGHPWTSTDAHGRPRVSAACPWTPTDVHGCFRTSSGGEEFGHGIRFESTRCARVRVPTVPTHVPTGEFRIYSCLWWFMQLGLQYAEIAEDFTFDVHHRKYLGTAVLADVPSCSVLRTVIFTFLGTIDSTVFCPVLGAFAFDVAAYLKEIPEPLSDSRSRPILPLAGRLSHTSEVNLMKERPQHNSVTGPSEDRTQFVIANDTGTRLEHLIGPLAFIN